MTKHANDRLQGTLDLLVLRILLSGGAQHGYGIAQRIHLLTDEALRIEEGSLYPALQRMTVAKWVSSTWGQTESGRRARFYSLTAAGKKQLAEEEKRWSSLTAAVSKVLRTV